MNRFEDFFDNHPVGASVLVCTFTILLSLAISFGYACLFGWLFMLAWNNLLPLVWATAPAINFWLSVLIMFVLRLIFKPIVHTHTKN